MHSQTKKDFETGSQTPLSTYYIPVPRISRPAYDNISFLTTTFQNDSDILTKLNPVTDASFGASRHSSCLEGTRIGILEKLMAWAKNPNSQPIFWLSGIAETGKSTISQSFCEDLKKENLLGASFFCSRESESLGQVQRIVPTLAYTLAENFKEYYDQIAAVLENNATVTSQGIKAQWKSLFMDPLNNIIMTESNWHFILVIDALDECKDTDATRNILSILRNMPAQFYSHLHIFISCRPEYYIHQELGSTLEKDLLVLHDMESEIVQKDIQLFLKSALNDIFGYDISEDDIACLAKQAGKLFIYASTQVKYLKEAPGQIFRKSRLSELRETKISDESIDELYTLVLRKATENMRLNEKEHAKYFVNIVVSLLDPLSQDALSELWKPCEVAPFRSVLNIPESKEFPIHIFHASFPDYILDKDRCHNEFYCETQAIHQIITLACLKIMNKNIRFNPCNMQTDDHVSSFAVETISPALQYSCKHWIYHLMRCGSVNGEVFKEIKEFFNKYFFFWMEHLCILDSPENAVPGLQSVSKWFHELNDKGSKHLSSITYEGQRFLQLIGSLVKYYPLQLYYSGMAWLPKESALHRVRGIPMNVPRVLHGLKNDWDTHEVTMRGSGSVDCVAFSPDGKKVVSASGNIVNIWNATTGAKIHEFDGHSWQVDDVAFSSDGKQVISASVDTTICIWNVATGEQIKQLGSPAGDNTRLRRTLPVKLHNLALSSDGRLVVVVSKEYLYDNILLFNAATGTRIQQIHHSYGYAGTVSVALSPDGKQVVCGSNIRKVYIWNADTGKRHTLNGHDGWVYSVAFSPDSKQVVSRSSDNAVRIWDVVTGKETLKLRGHSNDVKSVAFSPVGFESAVRFGFEPNFEQTGNRTGAKILQFDQTLHCTAVVKCTGASSVQLSSLHRLCIQSV